jgi:hypothetical protein
MSWIEKELKKRVAESKATAPDPPASELEAESAAKRLADLWIEVRALNGALPHEIQLSIDTSRSVLSSPEDASIIEWLSARNGAAIGFAETAVRYIWPERSSKRSKNFWIRWSTEKNRFVLTQRISSTIPPVVAEYRFNEAKVEYILRCLVQGKRIKVGAVRKRRLWIF